MTFQDCLLAEYVEARLDTYETRPCSYGDHYSPWVWICKLAGGVTEDCFGVATKGDKILDKAIGLASEFLDVRNNVWRFLHQCGIVDSAQACQPGNKSCTGCECEGDCTIQVSRQRSQAWIAEQLKEEAS